MLLLAGQAIVYIPYILGCLWSKRGTDLPYQRSLFGGQLNLLAPRSVKAFHQPPPLSMAVDGQQFRLHQSNDGGSFYDLMQIAKTFKA